MNNEECSCELCKTATEVNELLGDVMMDIHNIMTEKSICLFCKKTLKSHTKECTFIKYMSKVLEYEQLTQMFEKDKHSRIN